MTRFDFDSAVARAKVAEQVTLNILRCGWMGATNVQDLRRQHLAYDFQADLADQGVRIDAKVVQKSYQSIFWETRHDPPAKAWGERGVDMLFYWMPEPDRGYVIDLRIARPIVERGNYTERRLDYPSRRGTKEWWTFGKVVPLNAIASAIVDTIYLGEPGQ